MLTATLLNVLLVFGVAWLVLGAFLGLFFGLCIKAGETPFETQVAFETLGEPETAAELDDWLAGSAIDFDFNVWKRPTASTSPISMERGR